MTLINVFLMSPPQDGANPLSSFLPIILIVVVFYFFMIRPQAKKAKNERKFKEELKKGDKVVTIGGVHGKITEVNDKTFTIDVADNVKLKVERSAISMDATRQLSEAGK